MKANIVISNDRRYNLMNGRMNRVKEYIVNKLDHMFLEEEVGFKDSASFSYLRLKKANKLHKKLSNKQQLIKYGKE